MQVKCFKIYAVLCFLGIVLASPEEQLETLLQKPFWSALISKHKNDILVLEDQQLKIRDLFGTDSNPAIVDETNVDIKIRQFYHLLITVYSAMLFHYLNFVEIIKCYHDKYNISFDMFNILDYIRGKHEKYTFPFDCKNEILNLIEDCKPTLAMMVSSVLLLKSLYNNEENVPLERFTPFLKIINMFTHLDTPDEQMFFTYVGSLCEYIRKKVRKNKYTTLVVHGLLDVQEINGYFIRLNYGDYSPEIRAKHLEKFKIMNDTFFKKIEEMGFQYNESTDSASSILEKLTELYPEDTSTETKS